MTHKKPRITASQAPHPPPHLQGLLAEGWPAGCGTLPSHAGRGAEALPSRAHSRGSHGLETHRGKHAGRQPRDSSPSTKRCKQPFFRQCGLSALTPLSVLAVSERVNVLPHGDREQDASLRAGLGGLAQSPPRHKPLRRARKKDGRQSGKKYRSEPSSPRGRRGRG